MHYCYFYGGELDGWVFPHPNPGETFPAPGFCQSGTVPPSDPAQASYRLFQHWPGPTQATPHWYVYVHVQAERPAPEVLWRRVMPHVLGTKNSRTR